MAKSASSIDKLDKQLRAENYSWNVIKQTISKQCLSDYRGKMKEQCMSSCSSVAVDTEDDEDENAGQITSESNYESMHAHSCRMSPLQDNTEAIISSDSIPDQSRTEKVFILNDSQSSNDNSNHPISDSSHSMPQDPLALEFNDLPSCVLEDPLASEDVYRCESCAMVFPGQLQLDQHHSACAGGQRKPRFLCATCGAGFDLRNSYLRHTQTHQLRFVCATCGRSLSRRSHLRNHMRRVHGLADDVPLVAVGERVSKAVEPGPTPSLLDAATTAGVILGQSPEGAAPEETTTLSTNLPTASARPYTAKAQPPRFRASRNCSHCARHGQTGSHGREGPSCPFWLCTCGPSCIKLLVKRAARVGQRVDQRKEREQAAMGSGAEAETAKSGTTVALAGQPDSGRGTSEECQLPDERESNGPSLSAGDNTAAAENPHPAFRGNLVDHGGVSPGQAAGAEAVTTQPRPVAAVAPRRRRSADVGIVGGARESTSRQTRAVSAITELIDDGLAVIGSSIGSVSVTPAASTPPSPLPAKLTAVTVVGPAASSPGGAALRQMLHERCCSKCQLHVECLVKHAAPDRCPFWRCRCEKHCATTAGGGYLSQQHQIPQPPPAERTTPLGGLLGSPGPRGPGGAARCRPMVQRTHSSTVAPTAAVAPGDLAHLAQMHSYALPAPSIVVQQQRRPGEAAQGARLTQGVARGVAQSVIQRVTQGVTKGATQGVIQRVTQGVIQRMTQGLTEGVTPGATQRVTQGAIQRVTQGVTLGISKVPQGKRQPLTHGVTRGAIQMAPREASQRASMAHRPRRLVTSFKGTLRWDKKRGAVVLQIRSTGNALPLPRVSQVKAADKTDSPPKVTEVVDLAGDAAPDEHPQRSALVKVMEAAAVAPGCSAGGRDGDGQGGEDSGKTVFLDEATGVLTSYPSADTKRAVSAEDGDADADQSSVTSSEPKAGAGDNREHTGAVGGDGADGGDDDASRLHSTLAATDTIADQAAPPRRRVFEVEVTGTAVPQRRVFEFEVTDETVSHPKIVEVVDLDDDGVPNNLTVRDSVSSHEPRRAPSPYKVGEATVVPSCSTAGGQGGEYFDKTAFLDEATDVLTSYPTVDAKVATSAGDDDTIANQSVMRLYESCEDADRDTRDASGCGTETEGICDKPAQAQRLAPATTADTVNLIPLTADAEQVVQGGAEVTSGPAMCQAPDDTTSLLLHLPAVVDMFPCTACPVVFDSEPELQDHVDVDHMKLVPLARLRTLARLMEALPKEYVAAFRAKTGPPRVKVNSQKWQ